MLNPLTGAPTPILFSKPAAWDAFEHVFRKTDWKLRLLSLGPILFDVEHDDDFGDLLAGSSSWREKDQARAWVADRVLHHAAGIDNTCVRRCSQQHPSSIDGEDATLFASGFRRRIQDAIRYELATHFNRSVDEWEHDALRFVFETCEDRKVAEDFQLYVGLDQLASADDIRKAIKFVFTRQHWYLEQKGRGVVLTPDWRMQQILPRRQSQDDRTRARSLVARCVEVLVESNAASLRSGADVGVVTRASLRDDVERRFAKRGVWGLIDTVLVRDRQRYQLIEPAPLCSEAVNLIERQEERLFTPLRAVPRGKDGGPYTARSSPVSERGRSVLI